MKIAVLGESGSGKSCFLNSFGGKAYTGESTRFIESFKYTLQDGRRVEFFDCPGQASYKNERQKIKTRILNGHFDAIINVVCFGYNESEGTNVKIFKSGTTEVAQKYLEDNRKFELRQLKEWIDDITGQTNIKLIITLINKADVWFDEETEVLEYYKMVSMPNISLELTVYAHCTFFRIVALFRPSEENLWCFILARMTRENYILMLRNAFKNS